MSERFRYRAATAQGRILEGFVEAPTRNKAIDELRGQRLYPVAVEVANPTRSGTGRRWPFSGRHAAVAVWSRDVATLLGAGLPLDRALGVTAEHTTHEGLTEIVRDVRRSVQGGAGLAEALTRHPRYFPSVMVAMISAGEAGGALETVFEQLAEHLEEAMELRSQIRSALLYPALMAVVASIGVAILLLLVVPRFSAMLEEVGGQLPLTTRILVAGSQALVGFWWLWLGMGAGVGYAAFRALHRRDLRRRWHEMRLRLPWVGDLEAKYGAARFTRTLGILLRSGVAIVPAIEIARNAIGNEYLGRGVERAAQAVAQGNPLAAALSGTLPPMAVQMIAIGEESGRLEELCLRAAGTYDGEVRRALRTTVSLIEPTMILIFGALVGFVALAMLQAIYSINTNVF